MTAREQGGALGSALFRAEDGTWAAIARWPRREARDGFFAHQIFPPELLARQAAAVVERLPSLELDLVDDQWAPGS